MYYFVYQTTNLVNNKKYIGQHSTENLNDNYLGSGKILQKAIEKYGRENFKREILEFAENKEKLDELEISYIKIFNAANDSSYYNIQTGGSGANGLTGELNGMYGKTHSEETRKRISSKRLENFANGKYQRYKWTEERKFRASERLKEEFRTGKRKSIKKYGEDNPMFGKKGELSPSYGLKRSEETKEKLRNIVKEQYKNGRVPPMLGKNWDNEVKKKISESHKGKGVGKDNPNYGNKWTQEQREKMSRERIENKTCAGGNNGRAKAVMCIETGIIYECVTYASKELHCCRHQIVDCCLGKRETVKGYHWKYASQANTVPSE